MKILYMNSFSRSGETMLLRTLNTHPQIKVLHQLLSLEVEAKERYDVFKRIKRDKPAFIYLTEKEKTAIGITNEEFLLTKNAVFEIPHNHYGFILVRNPFSVFASYKKLGLNIDIRAQMRRWAQNIDKNLLYTVDNASLIEAFCSLYIRKMGNLLSHQLPIIHYETLVNSSETSLKNLLMSLNINWSDSVLHAEKTYKENERGHGGILLDIPIQSNFANLLPDLSEKEINTIYGYTSVVLHNYGYAVDLGNRTIKVEQL